MLQANQAPLAQGPRVAVNSVCFAHLKHLHAELHPDKDPKIESLAMTGPFISQLLVTMQSVWACTEAIACWNCEVEEKVASAKWR